MFGDFKWLLISFNAPLTKFVKIDNQFDFQDICKEAYPIGIQKDLETYARMIFWLVGCMNPKWRGLYIGVNIEKWCHILPILQFIIAI